MPEVTSSATAEISPLALSILELLDERPLHPIELASTMRDRHQDEFIRLNFGSLYHTVDVLERNGWIDPAQREKEGPRPVARCSSRSSARFSPGLGVSTHTSPPG